MTKKTKQYYIWITDYADSNDIIVKTRDGDVKVNRPKRVIALDAGANALFVASQGAYNKFLSETAIGYVVKKYDLDKINLNTSFWSIAPRATQQEMVELFQTEYESKNTINLNRETAH